MYIKKLELNNFRILENISLDLNDNVNIIIGKNGSGKTSILEAISTLALSKSFRTNNLSNLILSNRNDFIIKINLCNDINADNTLKIGMKRDVESKKILRINKKNAKTSNVAKELPFFILYSDYLINLVNNRQERLSLLNWGLFHVEHSFSGLWKQLQVVLKNRNLLLKNKASYNQVKVWDLGFIKISEEISEISKSYFLELKKHFVYYMDIFFPDIYINLDYYQGWDNNTVFLDVLKKNYLIDYKLGYSSQGSHRTDLVLTYQNKNIKDILSKGQQKMVSLALCLASLRVLKDKYNKSYIILVDDLAAELDDYNLDGAYKELLKFNSQIIITSIKEDSIIKFFKKTENKHIFYIKDGYLSNVPRGTIVA